MIFYLNTHPEKCAAAYAVEHLKDITQEALQVLCDATRLLVDECSSNAIEKKMKNIMANVRPKEYFYRIEDKIPLPHKGDNNDIVQWVTEGQDSWDWFFDFTKQLTREQDAWFGKGCDQTIKEAVSWIFIDAPRPVHAGRIYPRTTSFPLSKELPSDVFDSGAPVTKAATEKAYRKHYYLTYKDKVHYPTSRKPWWWRAFENIEKRTLASPAGHT